MLGIEWTVLARVWLYSGDKIEDETDVRFREGRGGEGKGIWDG